MTPYITEVLKEISDNPELMLTKYKDSFAVKILMQYGFDKTQKFVLPPGTPPFKPDQGPVGMSPANFFNQVKKLYIFTRTDLTAVRRETLFIQLLEGIHPTEAEICIAIKDQNLTSLYPGITADLVVKAGFVKEENIFRQPAVSKKTKSKGEHIVVTLQDSTVTKESFGAPPKEVTVKEPVVNAEKKRGRPKKK